MSFLVALLVVCAVIVLYVIGIYNGLVQRQIRVKEAWSTVETQLKRRYDLIPNLIETVKGYAKYESKTLEQVINARNMAMSVTEPGAQKEQQENMLSGALKSLFALSESYPDLKANTNYLELQQELSDTENKIQASRQFYNTIVSDFNTKIRVFPSNIVANKFQFEPAQFFELEEGERQEATQAPKISF